MTDCPCCGEDVDPATAVLTVIDATYVHSRPRLWFSSEAEARRSLTDAVAGALAMHMNRDDNRPPATHAIARCCSEACSEAMGERPEPEPSEADLEYAENVRRYGKRSADWVAAGEPDLDDR